MKNHIETREEYIKSVKAEILGPGSEFSIPDKEHELISSDPKSRYSTGILYPQGVRWGYDNDEVSAEIDDESTLPDSENEVIASVKKENNITGGPNDRNGENLDEEVGLSAQHIPSSMGITFLVKGSVESVHGQISFGTYRRAMIEDCVIPASSFDTLSPEIPVPLSDYISFDQKTDVFRLLKPITKADVLRIKGDLSENEMNMLKIAFRFVDLCKRGHVRTPHIVDFQLSFPNGVNYVDDCRNLDETTVKITALRTYISEDVWSVSVMCINDYVSEKAEGIDCIFQPVIRISSDNNDFVFIDNRDYDDDSLDEEEESLNLLYRNKRIFASGLGVSVDWDVGKDGTGKIWTDYCPEAEVPRMEFEIPRDKLPLKNLSMKFLSDLDNTEKSNKLLALSLLVDCYDSWIEDLITKTTTLDPHHIPAANRNIDECTTASKRMRSGIETLRCNDHAYDSFMLANRAMFMQRVHSAFQNSIPDDERYPGNMEIASFFRELNYYERGDCHHWRPFQLAFLLMDIDSIVHEGCDRDIVDLIWFPTGGGKTEAYLGLTAFTIFYRRLAHFNSYEGTAVIMRYTLRLLTTQQFTRAATLICACESIRKDCSDMKKTKYKLYRLGNKPITIGLLIGSAHTPNKNKDAAKDLDKLLKADVKSLNSVKERHNKFQLLRCPWCGTKLVKDIKNGEMIGKFGYGMRNKSHFYLNCTHEDCDFTKELPIQIVDEELYISPPTLLFGTVDKFAMLPWRGELGSFFAVDKEKNRTPELIVQDELHLISGALGTMVGLYETAIDALCSHKGVRPKIVASTATIRRAKEQCSVLYNRDVAQFPPPGLNAEDSFFAKEAAVSYDDNSYGRKYVGVMPSGKTKAMMEIRLISALLQKTQTMEIPDDIKDTIWTLTVYFNSLKDLGKASTLVEDDVKDFIIRMSNRMFSERRKLISADELTSRISTTELNETLNKLEKIRYSREDGVRASDIVLATNMISVGLDVERLNIMLILGQPKLTNEYIQASSRVGRKYPGVAFIQFDSTKSRDRSHYERFKPYHDSFYRYVEPTGATPFSKPARMRALHAVLIALMRNRAGMVKDEDAKAYNRETHLSHVEEIKTIVLERIRGINVRANNDPFLDLQEVEQEMNEFFDKWQKMANSLGDDASPLCFGLKYIMKPPENGEKRLLKQYNTDEKDMDSIETLTSMRNVDSQITGEALWWEDDPYE